MQHFEYKTIMYQKVDVQTNKQFNNLNNDIYLNKSRIYCVVVAHSTPGSYSVF